MTTRVSRTPTVVRAPVKSSTKTEEKHLVDISRLCQPGELIVRVEDNELSISALLDKTPKVRRGLRKDSHTHVSDLLGKCIRKLAIARRESIALMPDRLSISDELAYAQGDAIHDVIKWKSAQSDPRQVWGKWTCDCGHLYHDDPCTYDMVDPEDLCPLCDQPTRKYEEVSVYDDELMIVGNPDLIRWIRAVEAFHVTEVKSMAEAMWKELARPLPIHVMQVIMYWYLMRKAGYRMVDRVSIIYISKGYMFKGKPYKEFILDPMEELHRLAPYLLLAEILVDCAKDGTLPARTECENNRSPKAKKCETVHLCFQPG